MSDGQTAPNGIHIGKDKAVEISATDHAVDVASDAWKYTLNWISHNPILFIAILLFLGWLVISGRQTRIKMREMKLEYDATRSSVRKHGSSRLRSVPSDKGDAQ